MSDTSGADVTTPASVDEAAEHVLEFIIAYVALLVMAVVPIYFGSYASAAKGHEKERISSSDAAMFPVYASCSLFGLYLLFKVRHIAHQNYTRASENRFGGFYLCWFPLISDFPASFSPRTTLILPWAPCSL